LRRLLTTPPLTRSDHVDHPAATTLIRGGE
jgi:hypothetical protein